MTLPTPTASGLACQRTADFDTVQEALEYAAGGASGLNFYSGRGELVEVLPYRDLQAQAAELGRRMLAAGLAPGERAALIAETDGDFVRAFFACLYAGVIPVPLPLPTTVGGKDGYVANLRRMVGSAGAVAAIGPASLAGWLGAAVEGLPLKAQGPVSSFDGLSTAGIDLPGPDRNGLLYVQFSSGSTRFPLGVSVTQEALMANAHAISAHGLATTADDRCVSWLPFYHDMGLVGFLLAPMLAQLSVDFIQTREFARRPLLWLDIITRNRGTISYSPTFGYELCARRAESAPTDGLDLGTWRVAGVGGDMIRPARLQAFTEAFASRGFRGSAFLASYGMAEATLALSFAPLDTGLVTEPVDTDRLERSGEADAPAPDAVRTRDFVRCGPALPGHALDVRDAAGQALPERRVGRIFARGPSLMQAYFGRPVETGQVLAADGWLDTGDLGFVADGEIVITGRAKDLILVNGRNVWPQDLEWTIESEVESLRTGDVVAFAYDSASEERVVVLAQCRTLDSAERAALRDEIARIIRARHSIDAIVTLVPPRALPQTSSGKLSRAQAREFYRRGLFAEQEATAAAG
jgi:fatty-acyl-CoA synthase